MIVNFGPNRKINNVLSLLLGQRLLRNLRGILVIVANHHNVRFHNGWLPSYSVSKVVSPLSVSSLQVSRLPGMEHTAATNRPTSSIFRSLKRYTSSSK